MCHANSSSKDMKNCYSTRWIVNYPMFSFSGVQFKHKVPFEYILKYILTCWNVNLQLYWNKNATKWLFEHVFLKFERSVVMTLMQISILVGVYTTCFLIKTILMRLLLPRFWSRIWITRQTTQESKLLVSAQAGASNVPNINITKVHISFVTYKPLNGK